MSQCPSRPQCTPHGCADDPECKFYPSVTATSTARSPQEQRWDLMSRLRTAYQSARQMDMDMRMLLVNAHDELERIDHIIALRGTYRDYLPATTSPWWRFWE